MILLTSTDNIITLLRIQDGETQIIGKYALQSTVQCAGLKPLSGLGTVLVGLGNANTRAQNDPTCALFWLSIPVLCKLTFSKGPSTRQWISQTILAKLASQDADQTALCLTDIELMTSTELVCFKDLLADLVSSWATSVLAASHFNNFSEEQWELLQKLNKGIKIKNTNGLGKLLIQMITQTNYNKDQSLSDLRHILLITAAPPLKRKA